MSPKTDVRDLRRLATDLHGALDELLRLRRLLVDACDDLRNIAHGSPENYGHYLRRADELQALAGGVEVDEP